MSSAESKTAVDAIDKLTGPDWYGIFKELHAGMILDTAGQKKEAGKRLENDGNAAIVGSQAGVKTGIGGR